MSADRKIVATIEARMGSSRLPGKVLKEIQGKAMLEMMIERARRAETLDGIVVATTTSPADDAIVEVAQRAGVGCYRGSELNVMSRVLEAALAYGADLIVELTGDSPLIDPAIIDETVNAFLAGDYDYVANVLERTYPIGMDVQVFSTAILADAASRTDDPIDHEHVSLYIYRHPEFYKVHNLVAAKKLTRPDLRLTLDTPQDLALIRNLFDSLYPDNPTFSLADIIAYLDANPVVAALNAGVQQRVV